MGFTVVDDIGIEIGDHRLGGTIEGSGKGVGEWKADRRDK